ncbi:hypothetical protein HDU90_003713 [Geranomyces variabilis]|nr:hypothetical protein HDU90_003713 [Geranomyces variabilis]
MAQLHVCVEHLKLISSGLSKVICPKANAVKLRQNVEHYGRAVEWLRSSGTHPYKRPKNFVSLNDNIKKTKKLYGVGMYEFIGLLQEVKHRGRPAEGRNIRVPGHLAAWEKEYELATTSSHV